MATHPSAGQLRVGVGYDRHRFGGPRPLRLGGVAIPHSQGLVGHSDADVLLHAVIDALLGALGEGDIGDWFPDSAPENAGRDSRDMLRRVLTVDRTSASRPAPLRILNLDCTVFLQAPKLSAYKVAIRDSLAELLSIDPAFVNVKAKTGEHVGAVGREEAVDAQAVVLIEVPR